MDATWIASISLAISLAAFVVALVNKPYKKEELPLISKLDTVTASDLIHQQKAQALDRREAEIVRSIDPMRKRPGLATLRYRAEVESMKPEHHSQEVIANNVRALQS
jgi:hypothetical protein